MSAAAWMLIALNAVAIGAFVTQLVWSLRVRRWLREGLEIQREFHDWHAQRAERLDGRVSRWDALPQRDRDLLRWDVEQYMNWGQDICRQHESWLHGDQR